MIPSAFRLLAPNLGALDLPALAPHLSDPAETTLPREAADRLIADDLRTLEGLRDELARLPVPTPPLDKEEWNPYPSFGDEAGELEAPEARIGEALGRIEHALRRSGRLPVVLNGAHAPTDAQSRAIAHLAENARALLSPLPGTVYLEDEDGGEREVTAPRLLDLEGGFRFWNAAVSRWDDPAYVHVTVLADAAFDRELLVVFREGEATRYGTADEAYADLAGDPAEIEPLHDEARMLYIEAMIAAMERDVDRLRELVSQGVDLNHPDADAGLSPLRHAVEEYHSEGVRFLLDAGADPFRREDGESALGAARRLFVALSWLDGPKGALGSGILLFAKIAIPADEVGANLAAKELRALKEIIPMLEVRMGLPPTTF